MSEITKQLINNKTTFVFHCRDNCPYCNKVIFPSISTYSCTDDLQYIDTIMLCPACNEVYFEKFERTIFNSKLFESVAAYPYPEPQINLPKEIEDLFPQFYKIYIESVTAENHNLHEICGMGYRKAVESLVKQYAIELYPDDIEKIQNETLMQTIRRFPSPKIVTLATAATWLGNDQVHLITQHPEYDIQELKSFISVLCSHIIAEKELEKATALLNKKKTK